MNGPMVATTPLWPLGVYFLAVILLVTIVLVLSYLLGQRHRERVTEEPYESGIVPTGRPGMRLDVKFYLVAMLFVVFDIEAVFIFAWSVSMRELGWPGYFAILLFTVVLLAALFYLARMGALDWGPSGLRSRNVRGQGTDSV